MKYLGKSQHEKLVPIQKQSFGFSDIGKKEKERGIDELSRKINLYLSYI